MSFTRPRVDANTLRNRRKNNRNDIDDIDDDLLISAGPFVGVDTPLGPLHLAYAHGEGGENEGYLYLGRSF